MILVGSRVGRQSPLFIATAMSPCRTMFVEQLKFLFSIVCFQSRMEEMEAQLQLTEQKKAAKANEMERIQLQSSKLENTLEQQNIPRSRVGNRLMAR